MPDVFRLEAAATSQMDPSYIVELAETDLQAGLPTEAKKIVDAGFASGALGKGPDAASHKKLRDRATKGAADDAKSSNLGETAAAKAKDGTGLVNVGYAYVTMDQFDKGIDLIQKGIAKGLKNQEEAKIRLGIAYAKAGRKAEAVKAFESVGGDQSTRDLARYWAMWVNRPAATEAGPVPAASPAASK
jgi:tetratricopeptide (TPR) repeat protein